MTRACTHQLNYHVLSFLGTFTSVHENMMLPETNVFLLLRTKGPDTGKQNIHWSLIKHEYDSRHTRRKYVASSDDFRTMKLL